MLGGRRADDGRVAINVSHAELQLLASHRLSDLEATSLDLTNCEFSSSLTLKLTRPIREGVVYVEITAKVWSFSRADIS